MTTYYAEPTIAKFHADDAFFRGIRGPVGSGKSVGCCVEIFRRMCEQKTHNGVRKSRWAIIRNTFPELKGTTIKTWMDWFGDYTKITYGSPITGQVSLMYEGDRVEAEIFFVPMDVTLNDDRALRKLKSLELTGAWVNEASEIDVSVIQALAGRVGRYPSARDGGFSWHGIIADTNSCSVDNWWYRLSEEEMPEGWAFYSQPPALLLLDGQYAPNPQAENICNHSLGYDYYFQQLGGNTRQWVNVFILNNYGSHIQGNLVYGDYGKDNWCDVEFDDTIQELIWSHDFNFTPLSSIIMQRKGDTVYAVDEIVLESAVAKQAAFEFCERYAGYRGVVSLYGDASGHVGEKHGHASDYITIEQILRKAGFNVRNRVPRSNPSIKDGQATLQAKICDALGNRTFYVNTGKCKTLHKGLSTLELKKGSTFQEEDGYYQHITTAVRYYTAVEFPTKKNTATPFNRWGAR